MSGGAGYDAVVDVDDEVCIHFLDSQAWRIAKLYT